MCAADQFVNSFLLKGGDLDHMITQLKETGTTLEEALILDWFVQLTNAIWYIHSR